MIELTVTDWLQGFSCMTWDRLALAYKHPRLRVSETTITQELVFMFYFAKRHYAFPIYIYESTDEKANGNDLEILVETEGGFLKLAVQAKCLKKNMKYTSIHYPKTGTQQIEHLLGYSLKQQAIPIYLFYNTEVGFSMDECLTGTDIPKQLYGCSLVHAEVLKQNFFGKRVGRKGELTWKIPGFHDLNPTLSAPLHTLGSDLLGINANALTKNAFFANTKKAYLRFYNFEEIDKDPFWKDMLPPAAIGRITVPKARAFEKQPSTLDTGFRPAYRLVFANSHKRGGLTGIIA